MFGLMRRAPRLPYCGTCKTLGARYGQRTRFLLNHDTVFLAEMLMEASREPEWSRAYRSFNCLSLPKRGETLPVALDFAAAATIVLAHFKVADHAADTGLRWWRWAGRLLSSSYRHAARNLRAWEFPLEAVEAELATQVRREREASSLADVARPTAHVTGLFFAHGARLVKADAALFERIGERFGYLIYVLDAYEDRERDARSGAFNPLLRWPMDGRTEILRVADELDRELPPHLADRLRVNLEERLGVRPRVLSRNCKKPLRERWCDAKAFAQSMRKREGAGAFKGALIVASVTLAAFSPPASCAGRGIVAAHAGPRNEPDGGRIAARVCRCTGRAHPFETRILEQLWELLHGRLRLRRLLRLLLRMWELLRLLTRLALLLVPLCVLAQTTPPVFLVEIETSEGRFLLEAHRDWSPHGVDRLYEMVRTHYLDDSRFFRVRPDYIAQFGIAGDPKVAQAWRNRVIPDDPVRQSNLRGYAGFAMTGPNTRSTQIYINLKDNTQLDAQGFSPIARVVEGMDVVDRIYGGYGETSGGGVRAGKQQKLFEEGNAYLDREFPRLDKLIRATLFQGLWRGSALDLKSEHFYKDLLAKHFEDGLYVSIVPVLPPKQPHTFSTTESGNVIHAGVWTGRYLGGVGFRYAVTKDPAVRKHGGDVLAGLRRLQEVTGKPGLLARGYVRGNGPVEGWERDGRDSTKWHQGQGEFAGYRFYSDVSVDNFNAVLFGYAIYFDLAADDAQKKIIAHDVDRLMTHVLDNQCRIIDLDGKVTQYGHIGIDPNPARDDYYRQQNAATLRRLNIDPAAWKPALRQSLMLLPDLLIAEHITGKPRYREFYNRVIARFKDNPDRFHDSRPFSLERVARVNHSSEGQAYEAIFHLMRYERDPELRKLYQSWLADLWEMNWMEGNSLFTFMTLGLAPDTAWPHREDALKLAEQTLRDYPMERGFTPVMNSLRPAIERNPAVDRGNAVQSAKPLPLFERPLDNEYTWKGNPYAMDGWLKPIVKAMAFSCDDPRAAWFLDSTGHVYRTLDRWKTWTNASEAAAGAKIEDIAASPTRSYVLFAKTDRGVLVSRDGGSSWRPAAAADNAPAFAPGATQPEFRIRDHQLEHSMDGGKTFAPAMRGWRIQRAETMFVTPRGVLASGPGGVYLTQDGLDWSEQRFWREEETGASDFLDAYWMGRYYMLIPAK